MLFRSNNHDDADDQEPAGPARQPTDDATGKKIAKFMYAFAKKMRKHPKEASEVSRVADAFNNQGVLGGLKAWPQFSDQWFGQVADDLENKTGISISSLLDQNYHNLSEPLGEDEADASDDELFGAEPALSGAKRLIYNAGRKILHSLEQAWRNPAIQKIGRAHV